MERSKLLALLTDRILRIQKDSPILVSIDGVDASGKTTLADELARHLINQGHHIIRASIDGFHNPEKIRYKKGENSPEGYYYDSFNYDATIGVLLHPISSGEPRCQTAVFDYRTDSDMLSVTQEVQSSSILIMDGIFLLRPELIKYWDLKIYLDVDFQFTIQRAIKRVAEKEHIGSEQKIIDRYLARYIPGQKLYFQIADPKNNAHIIIDNSELSNPEIIKI